MINKELQDELNRLSSQYGVPIEDLENLIKLSKPKKVKKSFGLGDIKQAIYNYFDVSSTKELKKSKQFKMATEAMFIRLNETESWNILYRKFIGVLPGEDNETGEDCINGVNIFKYFKPWVVFNLDSKTATKEDIKGAYRELSKIYHPDMPTGNRRIFERIEQMYSSLLSIFD